MRKDEKNPKHWIADEGKVFQSLIDGQIMGSEIVLTTCHKEGVEQEDTIDNYIEVADPNYQPEEEGAAPVSE